MQLGMEIQRRRVDLCNRRTDRLPMQLSHAPPKYMLHVSPFTPHASGHGGHINPVMDHINGG